MKLSEYKQDYYTFTGKLSDINRQIAFAGIALIWIFKKNDGENLIICYELVLPAILLAIALGSDIMQYIYQSITWAIFYRYFEKRINNDDTEIYAPSILNYPSWFFFIVKVALVLIAYIFIIDFLIHNTIEK
ncbi:MAG TPA: hypothetical protein DER09_15580 [Prolixibacteraceae bacterium]|nr:hypothetical protein [Prolixibacteraceae bacterium]